MESEVLTAKQAAKRLGIDPSRVRYLCINEKLHGIKVGRDWLILTAEVDAYRRPPRGRPRKTQTAK